MKLISTAIRTGFGAFPPSVDCQSEPQKSYKFCDPSLTPEERASDLVSKLTTDEAIQQTWTIAPAISRLGIKAYNWRSNCLHGWSASGGHWDSNLTWTVFPAPMNLGATFDADLVKKVGQATSDEGRALHNVMLQKYDGESTEAAALNCFSPNVNLLRDPRWGRAEETFGEDPYVLSQIGVAYSRGLQEGDNPHYLKVVACAKHYVVHSGRDNDRSHFIANTTMHDLYDTYLPAFKSQIIGAKVGQIMPAYSSVRCSGSPDGAPDCANAFLLRTVLREQFGGYNVSVCSDNGGVGMVYKTHHYVSTAEDAAAVSMNASTDLDLGHDAIYSNNLGSALKDGKVQLETIQESVWRNFYWRIRLGDFDPAEMVPYQSIGADHLDTKASQALNLLSAQESIVLLKNEGNMLPLKTNLKRIAVIGPNAADEHVILSNYAGIPSTVVSVMEGINMTVSSGTYIASAKGCKDTHCSDKKDFDDALKAAQGADVAIMVMGLSGSLEGEGHDRDPTKCEDTTMDTIGLPGCQHDLIQAVAATKVPIVLVLMNGGPLSISWEKDNVPAIIDAFYPGALGGQAVADVLFGKYNPGGRMPVTTYMGEKDLPVVENYNMSFPPGRTYKYFTGEPLYPFGYGLSYTTFEYSGLSLSSSTLKTCDSLMVSAMINNTGKMDGDEVAQLYLAFSPKSPLSYPVPIRVLVGFQRLTIKAGDSASLKFTVDPYDMTVVNEKGERVLNPGSFSVHLGGQQPVSGTTGILSGSFSLTGDMMPISGCPHAKKCMGCLPVQ